MATYTKTAIHGSTAALFSGLLAGVISYATRVILARHLQPAEYGLFYAVFNFVIFFLFFRDLGLPQALVKYIAEFKTEGKNNEIKTTIFATFLLQLIGSIIFAIIFFFSSDFLAENYFKEQNAAVMLKILIFYVILSILFTILKQIFLGLQKFFLFSSVEAVKNILFLILVIILFKLNYGLFTPAIAYTIGCLILFFIYFPFVIRVFPFFRYKITNIKEITPKLLAFGLPVFLTSVGGKIIGYIDTLMLTYFRSLTEVGIYNVILPTAMAFIDFGTAVGTVIFPITTELWIKNDLRRLSEGLRLIHRYLFIITIPCFLVLFTFGEFFITLLFTEKYIEGTAAFQILLIGVLFFLVAIINTSMISAIGQPKIVTKIIILSAIINAVLNLFLIPKYGIVGAAFATTVSYFIILTLSTYKISKIINTKVPLNDWIKLLIPSSGFLGILYLFKINIYFSNSWLNIIIGSLAGLLIYLILLLLFNLINFEEIKKYKKIIKIK